MISDLFNCVKFFFEKKKKKIGIKFFICILFYNDVVKFVIDIIIILMMFN